MQESWQNRFNTLLDRPFEMSRKRTASVEPEGGIGKKLKCQVPNLDSNVDHDNVTPVVNLAPGLGYDGGHPQLCANGAGALGGKRAAFAGV